MESRALLSGVAPGLVVDPQAYSPSDILVSFKPGAAPAQVLPAGASLGQRLPLVSGLYRVDLQNSLTVENALKVLRADPRVAFAEPDYKVHVDLVPNDPSFGSLWGLNNSGQSGGTVDADIDGAEAWGVSTGTGGVTVAVIDTGVDYNHPDLAANIWTNSGEIPANGADDDGNGYIDDVHGYDWVNNDGDPMDDNSHGTHVAGTIGAIGNNGIGVAGIAWDTKIMALKFLDASGNGSTSAAINALNYAVNKGAGISNNSWGGGGYSQAMVTALTNARDAGHIFVAAAGNIATNNDLTPYYPAGYNLDNVVAVAATDRYDNLASFSGYGATTVDLAAPGVSIYSTIPGGGYGYKSGTSMATPHVVGALALVRDVHPGWSYSQIINQVLTTVDPRASLAGKTSTGGRLNVFNALGGVVVPTLPALSVSDTSVTEGNSGTVMAQFTVTLSAAASAPVTVLYTSANGMASAGSDYVGASGTSLTFASGETSKIISVVVNGDTVVESNETFFLNLSSPMGATLGDSQGLGTIQNDDVAPPPPPPPAVATVSITDVSVTERNKGGVSAVFTVNLSAASSANVTVYFATANGTATAGSDYVAQSGSLVFTPGQISKKITVKVNGDTAAELNEAFFLSLSNPSGATIADGQGQGTIVNDDGPAGASLTQQMGSEAVLHYLAYASTLDWLDGGQARRRI